VAFIFDSHWQWRRLVTDGLAADDVDVTIYRVNGVKLLL